MRYDELSHAVRERFQWDGETAEAVLAKEEKHDLLRERLHLLARQQAEQKKEESARVAATEKRIEDLERDVRQQEVELKALRVIAEGN